MSTSDETAAEEPRQAAWWSKSEHDLFLQALQEYGRNWKKIAEAVGTRTMAQVRSHGQKYFMKLERQRARMTRRSLMDAPQPQAQRSERLLRENCILRNYIQTLASVNLAYLSEFRKAFQGEELAMLLEQSAMLANTFKPAYF